VNYRLIVGAAMAQKTPPTGVPLASLTPSWELSLAETNKSPKTIGSYQGTAERLVAYLKDHGLPDDTELLRKAHMKR
jgi:hypothetical protein